MSDRPIWHEQVGLDGAWRSIGQWSLQVELAGASENSPAQWTVMDTEHECEICGATVPGDPTLDELKAMATDGVGQWLAGLLDELCAV